MIILAVAIQYLQQFFLLHRQRTYLSLFLILVISVKFEIWHWFLLKACFSLRPHPDLLQDIVPDWTNQTAVYFVLGFSRRPSRVWLLNLTKRRQPRWGSYFMLDSQILLSLSIVHFFCFALWSFMLFAETMLMVELNKFVFKVTSHFFLTQVLFSLFTALLGIFPVYYHHCFAELLVPHFSLLLKTMFWLYSWLRGQTDVVDEFFPLDYILHRFWTLSFGEIFEFGLFLLFF